MDPFAHPLALLYRVSANLITTLRRTTIVLFLQDIIWKFRLAQLLNNGIGPGRSFRELSLTRPIIPAILERACLDRPKGIVYLSRFPSGLSLEISITSITFAALHLDESRLGHHASPRTESVSTLGG
jgi:hypothetical protein